MLTKFILNILTLCLACMSVFIPILTPFHLMQEHHWKPAPEIEYCNQNCSDATHHQHKIECDWFAPIISDLNFLFNSKTYNFNPENPVSSTIAGPYRKPLVFCINISRAPPSFL